MTKSSYSLCSHDVWVIRLLNALYIIGARDNVEAGGAYRRNMTRVISRKKVLGDQDWKVIVVIEN